MRSIQQRVNFVAGLVLAGAALLLTGCDETIRTTVEDGIINTSSALLNATVQALIAAATSPT